MRLLTSAVGLTLVAGALAAPAPPAAPDDVLQAIDRGIRFLRQREAGRGHWEDSAQVAAARPGGMTALAVLALLEAGVKPDDAVVRRGLDYLRKLEPKHTYCVGLQTAVFARVGDPQDRPRIQRNVDWLVAARVLRGGKLHGWGYDRNTAGADNSNSQFAVLGLDAGRRAGARIPADVWQSVRDFYLATQEADGEWGYSPDYGTRAGTLTMTVAGVNGLAITGAADAAARLRPDGTAAGCDVARPEVMARGLGLAWVGDHFGVAGRQNVYYGLYGLARLGRNAGPRMLGGRDWYREGAAYLLANQRPDGSWSSGQSVDAVPVVSTSFAVLFLAEGRTPVVLAAFAHGAGDAWDTKPNAARHLADYAGRELFHGRPLTWQVWDARKFEPAKADDLDAAAAELGRVPIVWLHGHRAPQLAVVQKELLRRYVARGGLLLADACCGDAAFGQAFRALAKELWPDDPLRPLPPDHPLWKAHAAVPPAAFPLEGIDCGGRLAVVFSPGPLSGWWDAGPGQSDRGDLAFRLAGNVLALGTKMMMPPARTTAAKPRE
ncbi:MAG TPA: DUF4159 domain-containing protein [Gemmataceae bacterium]|jgi:hypothetical protein